MFATKFPSLHQGMEPCPGHRLEEFIGRGSYGEVWQARGPDNELCALKMMRCLGRSGPYNEIRALQQIAKLEHHSLLVPNRVTSWQQYLVVTMDLAEGCLYEMLRLSLEHLYQPLPVEQICDYLTQVAEALDFLNEHRHDWNGKLVGIQHADVKPSNILIFGDEVKLADFGLAVPLAQKSKTHRKVGTPFYASPEQWIHGEISDHSDQYALAVTWCELRTGKLPFSMPPGHHGIDPLQARLNFRGIPKAEQPILQRALQQDPWQRWPSCQHLLAELRHAAIGATKPVVSTTPSHDATAFSPVDC